MATLVWFAVWRTKTNSNIFELSFCRFFLQRKQQQYYACVFCIHPKIYGSAYTLPHNPDLKRLCER